jgi:hypothetical protein
MPLQSVRASHDGPRATVNGLIRNPEVVRQRILSMLDQQFIADALFRRGPQATSGSVVYSESEPLFADGEPSIIEEFGEIPIIGTSTGLRKSVATTKQGFGYVISRETRTRSNWDRVRTDMTKLRNTMVRTFDDMFVSTFLTHPRVHTLTAAEPWYKETFEYPQTSGQSIRWDLGKAKKLIADSTPEGRPKDFFGFQPDTLLISENTAIGFTDSDRVNEVFAHGNLADQQLRYRGVMPRTFWGLNVVQNRRIPDDIAVVMERGTAGFISDEWGLDATPLYEDRPRQQWRSDVTRRSVAALDQPGAVCIITNILDSTP